MINKRIVFPKLRFRFLSVMMDFILFSVFSLLLIYLVFNKVFDTKEEENIVVGAQIYAGVLVLDTDTNIYNQLSSSDYLEYEKIVEDYYLTDKYFGSSFYIENGGNREKYSIETYNTSILYIGESESYFEYQTINDVIDTSLLGVIKAKYYTNNDRENGTIREEYLSDFLSFYSKQYKSIFTDLYNDEYYNNARNTIRLNGAYVFFYSLLISYSLVYIIPPLTNKYGFSLGRFSFNLALVSKDGFYQHRYMFLIRNIIPIILISIILLNDNLFFIGTIVIVYYLLNWLICVMNKENASLLDYISFSRVVNKKESEIFNKEEGIIDEEE